MDMEPFDAKAQGGAFDGADDLPTIGLGHGPVPVGVLRPRAVGELFEQSGLAPLRREDVVRPAVDQVTGVATLRKQGICGDNDPGRGREVLQEDRELLDPVAVLTHRHLGQ